MSRSRFAVAVEALEALYDADAALARLTYRRGVTELRDDLTRHRKSAWKSISDVI